MNTPTIPSYIHFIPCLNDICGENLNISTSDFILNQEVDTFQTSSQHGKRDKSPLLHPKKDTQKETLSEDNEERREEQSIPSNYSTIPTELEEDDDSKVQLQPPL